MATSCRVQIGVTARSLPACARAFDVSADRKLVRLTRRRRHALSPPDCRADETLAVGFGWPALATISTSRSMIGYRIDCRGVEHRTWFLGDRRSQWRLEHISEPPILRPFPEHEDCVAGDTSTTTAAAPIRHYWCSLMRSFVLALPLFGAHARPTRFGIESVR